MMASATKSRFGFHDHFSSESMPPESSPPETMLKSVSRENPGQLSAIRRIGEWDDGATGLAPPASQSFEFREDPSFWKDHNVQVIIRIRPLSSSEISFQGYSKCVRQESCQTITWTGHPESRFTFDLVADENVCQENLFKVAGLQMVENCMGGYNSCMFAYGQTGSGKTHTMLGDIEGGSRRHSVNAGMTPRVFEYLFSRIQKEKEARKEEKIKFACKCSFLEIYNEQILDLLDPSSNNLQIREDIKKGVHVENLKEIEVTSARDVMQQLIQGAANRKVAATNMNHASSRSHSVFTCTIESKWESQGVNHHRFARLNLVDLAGSERQKSSGAEGERLKEATNINKSLSTLGLVIMNLVNISNGKSLHVPYRDSKLTFLLQDSLGGNSKTIIIANISPSSCCSLETLSTLKFAQRAKFIKNNAIVNEDASGDVIAMRMQIQQLKKEVSHLRGLVNGGGESLDTDISTMSFPGSPVSFKWEGLHGSFSPFTSDKRITQKKDYDVALVGAFRREKEKDITLQALAAEIQAAMQLAKRREDEIQGLKMRLRFREAGIKRLEQVASGKISAEAHLLKEREEYMKEIEVLRSQVDRNQEVTRFAMENLRLKEEIRRLKSFCEEGEREMLNKQIMVLQNKLLEALDWKLMHENDSLTVQNANPDTVSGVNTDGNLHLSGQEDSAGWSSLNEENEFFRMQAIHNQSEMEALQKDMELCLEEKEKLERHISDLLKILEEERSSKAVKEKMQQTDYSPPNVNFNDQMELKTMVDAIAAASRREAEALERVFKLSQENDELRLRVKGYVEDNKQLLELYEQKAAESSHKSLNNSDAHENDSMVHDVPGEKDFEMKKGVENLEQQLMEMHEENEKLMGLYEKAMQERDEFKRMLSSSGQNGSEPKDFDCPEKFIEVDGEERLKPGEPVSVMAEDVKKKNNFPELNMQDTGEIQRLEKSTSSELELQTSSTLYLENMQLIEENESDSRANELLELSKSLENLSMEGQLEKVNSCIGNNNRSSSDVNDETVLFHVDHRAETRNNADETSDTGTESLNFAQLKLEDLNHAREELEMVQQKLSDSAKNVVALNSLVKAFLEVEKLSREIEAVEGIITEKQLDFESTALLSLNIKGRRDVISSKLSALKCSVSNFSSSVSYFAEREARATVRLDTSLSYLKRKKEELAHLQECKGAIEASKAKIQEAEVEVRNSLALLKLKLKEENDKVLLPIDNMEKLDSHRHWHLGGKATELLKSEEEKNKLQHEMKLSREKLGTMRKEFENLNKKAVKLEIEMQHITEDIEKGTKSVEEMKLALQGVIQEMKTLLEVREDGKAEMENIILENHQQVFEADLKEAEVEIIEREMQQDRTKVGQLQAARAEAANKLKQLLDTGDDSSCLWSENMEAELQDVCSSIKEAIGLLVQ